MHRSTLALRCSLALAALTFHLTPLLAADEPSARTDEQILASVKLPEGYEATVFAKPPQLGYPTSVSAAVDGTLFVAVDENGSLGQARNSAEKPRGYVMRLRDTDGDGRADEFKKFAEMESPRGVIWDGPSGTAPGTLYVMYPPKLSAFTDSDGDGVADQQEDIVTGLGFDLGFRGADHTTNGCRLAIDGFIYIAVGDYGFTKAVAKDGTTLSMRGGGIVRVRPDGTGFEIVSQGQRNIYDVAVSPTLDLFTRDNTNDGGGWDVRLSFVPPGAHMGYPTLFMNFPEDHLPPLAVLGGGSPCGALWIDEPGLQNGLYTVEWGRNAIMYHPLTPDGAGWKAGPEKEWLKMTRPTDMDVDASGRIYIASWEGATFDYNGPNAGYVLRVGRKGAQAASVVDLGMAMPVDLAGFLASESASLRGAASREFVRRSPGAGTSTPPPAADGAFQEALTMPVIAAKFTKPSPSVYAAQLLTVLEVVRSAKGSWDDNAPLSRDADQAEIELLAQGSVGLGTQLLSPDALAGARLRPEPRVRAAAVTALRRLGKAEAAAQILPLVADADPIVSHLAIRALSELKASQACLAALDAADERVKPGALQALYGIYEPAVVDGLIARLQNPSVVREERRGAHAPSRAVSGAPAGNTSSGAGGAAVPAESDAALAENESPARVPKTAGGAPALPGPNANPALSEHRGGPFDLRRGILNALCRLANQDAPYLDPKEWWGTRPDTSGPVYKPVRWAESTKIEAALKAAADAASGNEARWLIQRMVLAKVNVPGLIEKLLALCGNDTPARLTAVEGLFRPDHSLPGEGVAALVSTATSSTETPDLRARALRLLQRGSEHDNVFTAAVGAFAPLAGRDLGHAALTAAFEDFTRDVKNAKRIDEYARLAAGDDVAKRTFAQTVLVNLATSALVKGKEKEKAELAVAKSWEKPESAASLLGVIARTKAKTYAAQVDARLNDPNNAVAEAALFAHQALSLGAPGTPAKLIGAMKYEEVFAAVAKGGDAKLGQEIYLRAGCIACHTVDANEPVKGPVLSAAAKIYDRAALAESILKPNAKLAQGFESVWVKTKKGEQAEGFITREGGDSLDLRNVVGQTVTIEKGDIVERGKREISMMPEGLMNGFQPAELASLLDYLESLKGK